MTIADMQRYNYGGLATALLENEPALAIGALEKLASELGIEDSARGFIDGSRASEEGMKVAASVYGKKYGNTRDDCNVDELYDIYDTEFIRGEIGDVKADKLKAEVNKFAGTKFGDIRAKIKKAKYILDGEKSGVTYTPTEITDAKDTLGKYKKLIEILSNGEGNYFERLRPSAVERTYKEGFEKIADSL